MAAEAEAVRDCGVEIGDLARHIRDVVEVALGIRLLEVDRRGDHAVAERERGEDRLDCAGDEVACALTYPTSVGSIPASSSAARIARAGLLPVGSGSVICDASADIPYPISSA